ncbi:MAG: hypothetical protein HRU34_12525 [Richelia sp.]|nr:hypothetical protein [Richelia sp.]
MSGAKANNGHFVLKRRLRQPPLGVMEAHRQKKIDSTGEDSVMPGRGIKTLSKPNKYSYPYLALPYPTESSPVARTLVGHKNGDLSIK